VFIFFELITGNMTIIQLIMNTLKLAHIHKAQHTLFHSHKNQLEQRNKWYRLQTDKHMFYEHF